MDEPSFSSQAPARNGFLPPQPQSPPITPWWLQSNTARQPHNGAPNKGACGGGGDSVSGGYGGCYTNGYGSGSGGDSGYISGGFGGGDGGSFSGGYGYSGGFPGSGSGGGGDGMDGDSSSSPTPAFVDGVMREWLRDVAAALQLAPACRSAAEELMDGYLASGAPRPPASLMQLLALAALSLSARRVQGEQASPSPSHWLALATDRQNGTQLYELHDLQRMEALLLAWTSGGVNQGGAGTPAPPSGWPSSAPARPGQWPERPAGY